MTDEPRVIVLGGANGAGKSTVAAYLVPDGCPFLNADEIAKGLEGPANFRAGKLFFEEAPPFGVRVACYRFLGDGQSYVSMA